LQGVKISVSDAPRWGWADIRHCLAGELQFRQSGKHATVRHIRRAHDFVDADGRWRERSALGADRLPDGLAREFVLVDNGSTDHTADVVADVDGRLPIPRVVALAPGLSNARNCGLAAARGDYICWTDDDVVIDANWLAAHTEAFARHPEATAFGGVIAPVFEREPPQWWFRSKDWLMHKAAVAWAKSACARLHLASGAWLKPLTDFQYLVGALNHCSNHVR
jgi:glycosyltransferase involved in cell wall biosynthesis